MSNKTITLLEYEKKLQETHFFNLQALIEENYKSLKQTIEARNKCIKELTEIENAIAILKTHLTSDQK